MESVQSITVENNNSSKTYHVYYNQWNGEIVSISRNFRDDIDSPYIVSDNPACRTIILGEANTHEYCVSFDREDNLVLQQRDQVVRFQSIVDDVFMVPKLIDGQELSEYDIQLTVYILSNTLVVNINPTAVARLTNLSNRMEVLVEATNNLDIYLTKYNFPDFFIGKFHVDPMQLLEQEYIAFDLSEYMNLLSLSDIGVLTKRCFNTYVMRYKNESFQERKHTNKIAGRTYCNYKVQSGDMGHLVLTQSGNRVTINTDLTMTELKEIGLYKSIFDIHVVGDTPDYYYDTLKVNVDDLKRSRRTTTTCEYDLSTCNMVHAKDYVLVTLNNGEE